MPRQPKKPVPLYRANFIGRFLFFVGESVALVFSMILILMALAGLIIMGVTQEGVLNVWWQDILIGIIFLLIAWAVFAEARKWLLDLLLPCKIYRGVITKLEWDLDGGVEGSMPKVYEAHFADTTFFVPESCWNQMRVGRRVAIKHTAKRKKIVSVWEE